MVNKSTNLPTNSDKESNAVTDPVNKRIFLKKRWRRIKPTRRNVERNQKVLLRHAHKFITGRWNNLCLVRRRVVSWLLLVSVLVAIGCVQMVLYSQNETIYAAVGEGTYSEGVVGAISSFNPLFADTDDEKAVSSLVYQSLYVSSSANQLDPQLAVSYSVSDDAKTYTVKLRDNVKWSDGEPFSADDVVYTMNLIKDLTTGSSLRSSWQNIESHKVDDLTVSFTLANPYAHFPFALTFGILPEHILKDIKPVDMRSFISENKTKVVGTGPFVYRSSELTANSQSMLHFERNSNYSGIKPRLKYVNIATYKTSADLLSGYNNREVNAAAGVALPEAKQALTIASTEIAQPTLADGVFALFNVSGGVASNKDVRQALRLATNRDDLLKSAVNYDEGLDENLGLPQKLETPIQPGIFSDVDNIKQPSYDSSAAAEKLNSVGWELNSKGQREKDGELLTIDMVTVGGTDYESVAEALSKQWQQLGVDVNLTVANASTVQQDYVITRAYDVLIYQIHLGSDPDILAYWGSSQATARGLNFSNYKSTLADLALTRGRSETNFDKRQARYVDFTNMWVEDVPAIALYQPNYYYLKNSTIKSLNGDELVSSSVRFQDVSSWTANAGQLKNTP